MATLNSGSLTANGPEKKGFVGVSLNIGGRNTNPLEFLLDGDQSKAGEMATKARVRAQEAMVDAECGKFSFQAPPLSDNNQLLST